MRIGPKVFFALFFLVGSPPRVVSQAGSPGFGTPAGTANIAATATFIDILGLKIGMPAEGALALVKSNNPTSTITLQRTRDYEHAWDLNLSHDDPKKQWVYEIDVEPGANGGDKIWIGLTLPPSKQVVHSVARHSVFKEPVAVENIVAGLRKKYGHESLGAGDKTTGVSILDSTGNGDKWFSWVYDLQGNQLKAESVAKINGNCLVGPQGGMGVPDIEISRNPQYDRRPYSKDKRNPCDGFVVLSAKIMATNAPAGINGNAIGLEVAAFNWPLVASSANALYGFLDERARELSNKDAQDAKKRGSDVKY